MACNSCTKPYSLFRKEKGCPGCGFSYCSKCLDNKIFLSKINGEAKVCSKCKNSVGKDNKTKVEPPDAYYKRIGVTTTETDNSFHSVQLSKKLDLQIHQRLQQLKEERNSTASGITDDEIKKRLQNIRGNQVIPSDAELQSRLANLREMPFIGGQSKTVLFAPDLRTEQKQADDLMKQYLENANIDKQYKEGFDKQIDDIETRMQKLKGSAAPTTSTTAQEKVKEAADSEDEDTTIKKIIEMAKVSALQDDKIPSTSNDELPFCEICNEDARMRCLGCRYLFCKECFMEHKDDDDGCDKYEPYIPSKTTS